MKNIITNLGKYFSRKKEIEVADESSEKDIRIVVQPWGFVLIAEYHRKGSLIILSNCYMIGNWGTKKALGELALNGPTAQTKLYKEGKTEIHQLMIIRSIKCNNKVWKEYF